EHIADLKKRIDRQFHTPLHVAGVVMKLTRILTWRLKARALVTIPPFLVQLVAGEVTRRVRKWFGKQANGYAGRHA
ncbi:MAG: hypothetical protein HYV60_01970, partial [Planctomycetia bacterium]|nr:hypothetical protein [Planctomycetia bacterium]